MLAFRTPRTRVAAVAVLALLALTGCSPDAPTGPTASPPPASNPSPGETTDPAEPSEPAVPEEFIVGGSADDNAPVLQGVLERLADQAGERPAGRAAATAAIDAGFERDAMEVTADTTPLGLATDAVTLAVRIQDDCVVAELRGTTVTTLVTPVLSTGRCLVGAPVSLD